MEPCGPSGGRVAYLVKVPEREFNQALESVELDLHTEEALHEFSQKFLVRLNRIAMAYL